MEYYFIVLIGLVLLFSITKIIFAELSAATVIKQDMNLWFLQFDEKFTYQKSKSMAFIGGFVYLFTSLEEMFSGEWFLGLVLFIGLSVISDMLSQYIMILYTKIRFRSRISEAHYLVKKIDQQIDKVEEKEALYSPMNYNSSQIINEILDGKTRVCFSTVDGGDLLKEANQLPELSYILDSDFDKASQNLSNRDVKLIQLTDEGKMPFKDNRLDAVVNLYANYDKFELYRILKPGGYAIFEQKGSDNFLEVMGMFVPFKIKGRWDMENCVTTLENIGFEVIEKKEDIGNIKFYSLKSVIDFVNQFTHGKLNKDERFYNFYSKIQRSIEKFNYFKLTTHNFVVVVRKPEV